MQAEAFGPQVPGLSIGGHNLFVTDTVLRLHRVADDVVPFHGGPGIVSKTDQLRHCGHFIYQGDIVQVDDTPAVGKGFTKVFRAGVVGRKHDVIRFCAHLPALDKFGNGAAVKTKTKVLHYSQDSRVGKGFNGKIFMKTLNSGKSPVQVYTGFPDPLFIIDMKRRFEMIYNIVKPRREPRVKIL